jgi:hypothetical protein
MDDDEARWAEAQSLLDRRPTESAEQRLRTARCRRWLLLGVLLLVVGAAGAALGAWLAEPGSAGAGDVGTWRVVVGFSLSGAGLLAMVVALFLQIRRTRRLRGWRSPLLVLSRAQRKELVGQVRGRISLQPRRLPLARHLAELQLIQEFLLIGQVGLLVHFAGLAIAEPETWRLVIVWVGVPVWVALGIVVFRESRRARRFLAQHPADASAA